MDKKISITDKLFSHQLNDNILELREAADSNVVIVSTKRNKEHFTTSLTKADLHILKEFLKLRGVE